MPETSSQTTEIRREEGFGARVRRSSSLLLWRSALLFWRCLGPLFVGRAARVYRRKSQGAKDVGSAVALAFGYSYFGLGIAPLQVREEIQELLSELAQRRPRTVLEIGTARGGTLFLFSKVASEDAMLISVDLPKGEYGGGYPAWKGRLFRSLAGERQEMHLMRANSHDPSTKEEVGRMVGGRGVDFLFIDGDHTYEGVRRDFELYSPLVNKGGVIAIHDILPHKHFSEVGVHKLWEEVRGSYDSHEIVGDRAQGWAGIGVLNVR